MKTVCIVQAMAKQYRRPFFDGLYAALAEAGICLQVAYSDPNPREARRGDNIDLPATYGRKISGHWLAGERLLYQSLWSQIREADLLVIEQANKYLMNYLLLAASRLKVKKVAYWGHGRNRQLIGHSISEYLKRRLINGVDWWFAYTQGVARYLESCGVRPERITTVQNSIDVSAFRAELDAVSEDEISALRRAIGLAAGHRVGLYCGGLHADKCLSFLIEAAAEIHRREKSFHLVVVGAGTEANLIEVAAQRADWVHYLGPKFGHDKAVCFRLGEIFLCPGLIGLAVLDAFAAGLPAATTDLPIHSPEIEYLEHGRNGVITSHDVASYADAVTCLLGDGEGLAGLREKARWDSERFGLARMVANFREGVLACLQA